MDGDGFVDVVSGDIVGVEMEAFATEMSVALFSRNSRPVGTCYYTQSNRDEFLPTIGLCSNGYDIEIDVCWQNMNCGARNFDVVSHFSPQSASPRAQRIPVACFNLQLLEVCLTAAKK